VSFIGFPSAVGSNGITASLINEAAIYSSADNKEGAWEFIKFILTKAAIEQSYYNLNTSFPMLTLRLQKLADDSFKDYYINESGERINNRLTANYGNTDIEYKLPDLTDADVQEIMSLIDSVDGITRRDLQIINIINEEMNKYLNGITTAEETAAMLQDRVSTYLSETY
jgi:ABC-type glycerol-3-phosphate transport system substrate-binding protein